MAKPWRRVSREEYDREKDEIEAVKLELARLEIELRESRDETARLRSIFAGEREQLGYYVDEIRAARDRLERGRSERASAIGRVAAYTRWRGVYARQRRLRVFYQQEIDAARAVMEHLGRSVLWWRGRIDTLEARYASLEATLRERRLEISRAVVEASHLEEDVIDPLKVKLRDLEREFSEKLLPVEEYHRVHKSHMFYATEPGEDTPTPWMMVSAFVYTQTPDAYTDGEFDLKLEVVEYGAPSEVVAAFPEVAWWEGIESLESNLASDVVDYKVEGIEREAVDKDEVQYSLDQERWYVLIYANPHAGRRKAWEYYGPIEKKTIKGLVYYAARRDRFEPAWKKAEARGWRLPREVPSGWTAPWFGEF